MQAVAMFPHERRVGGGQAQAMCFACVQLRKRGLDQAQNGFGIDGQFTMQNTPRDRDGKLHGIVLGFRA